MRDDVYSVLPDANILYSRTLRDWVCLISLTSGETTHRVWTTEDILAEATYRFRRNNPEISERRLSTIRRNTSQHAALITDYTIDRSLPLYEDFPDRHDLHLLEAARHLPVDAVITNDERLLTWAKRHHDELFTDLMSGDDFLMQLVEYHPEAVFSALQEQHSYCSEKISRGEIESVNYVASLCGSGAPRFAGYVSQLLHLL